MTGQVFVRCGAPSRTLALPCDTHQDLVQDIKQRIGVRLGAEGAVPDMVLVHAGHVLHDSQTLAACGVPEGSSLHLSSRLRGGGGDGGSTGAESRSCYLEMYATKKKDKVNPAEELLARWTQCHLSGAALQPPCVVDELGTLYNKDAVVQALLSKTIPDALSYITGLKSVTELKLEPNPNAASRKSRPTAAAKGLHNPGNDADFCCPITGLEFNGRFRFMVHRPTGRVLAEKAVKEVPQVVEELLGCKPAPEDWIPVNPSGEQREQLRTKVAAAMAAERERKARRASAKADKSAAAAAAVSNTSNSNGSSSTVAATPRSGSGEVSTDAHGPASTQADKAGSSGNGTVGSKRGSPSSGLMMPPPAPAAAAAAALAGGSNSSSSSNGNKRMKGTALEVMPKNADNSVYASLFTSSLKGKEFKETYMCRSTSARGINLS